MSYDVVIGLEVHAQLLTATKIFASSSAKINESPNAHIDPVTLGMPGSLPVLNKRVVEYAIKAGLATNCEIESRSVFARKHYFYPDLPKGYQISQYELPICTNGSLSIKVNDTEKKIRLNRIHLEEDAGKSIHSSNEPYSLVDLNRAGVPLIEMVTEPDLSSAEEAIAFLKQLRQIVCHLGICDGNMDQGSFRCDANISLKPSGQKELGTKVEIKNINSFRFVERAIDYEISRQKILLEQDEEIVQETRLWDEQKSVTRSMRSKEEAEDYRYFPDPDLLPLIVDEDWIDKIKSSLPELPYEILNRFQNMYSLDLDTATLLSEEKYTADYFDQAVATHNNAKSIASWICNELFGKLNKENVEFIDCPVSPEHLAKLVKLVDENLISGKIAKTVFEEMFSSGEDPEKIVEEQGLKQITDTSFLKDLVKSVLDSNPEQVQEYKAGKQKVFGFFVGKVMKETEGKANPAEVNGLLKELLK